MSDNTTNTASCTDCANTINDAGQRLKEVKRQRKLRMALQISLMISIIALVAFGAFLYLAFFSAPNIPPMVGDKPFANQNVSDMPAPPVYTYTVTLDVSSQQSASVEPASLTNPKGTAVTHLPYAKRDGLRFTGWWTAPEGNAEAVRVDNNSLGALSSEEDTTLYARFEAKPTTVDYAVKGLPILMYHYFYDPGAGEVSADGNHLNINMFEDHLRFFQENNYYYPTWDEVSEYIRGNITLPERSVVLTSDDGHESVYRLAIPLVEKYNARITLFVIAIGFSSATIGEYDPNIVSFMSHSYDMHRAGWDGQGRLMTASFEEVAEDVRLGEEILGNRMVYCYPFGHTDETVRQELAANGVQLAVAIINERSYPLMDPLELPRLRISENSSLEFFIDRVG